MKKNSFFLTDIINTTCRPEFQLKDTLTFSLQGQKVSPLLPLEVSRIMTVLIFSFNLSNTLCTYSEVGRIAYFELIFAFFLEERTEGLEVRTVFFYQEEELLVLLFSPEFGLFL
jgi:hypothetical protein